MLCKDLNIKVIKCTYSKSKRYTVRVGLAQVGGQSWGRERPPCILVAREVPGILAAPTMNR